jgi:hypothetical protein
VWLLVALAGLSIACTASPSPSASIAGPSATPVQAGIGCELVDLRGPDGEAVDLTGDWAGSGVLFASGGEEVAILNQVGGCVYGSVTMLDWIAQQALANLSGRINPDFTIDIEVVIIRRPPRDPVPQPPFAEYGTVVMVIEWDEEGRLRLREDREFGRPERCTFTAGPCPPPVIWYPVEAGPTS